MRRHFGQSRQGDAGLTGRAGRAVGFARRLTAAALVVLLAASLASAPLRAQDLMLMEPPRTNYRGFGWLFLVATLGSIAVASNDYSESQKNLDLAKKSYAQYQVANTSAAATQYHNQTESQLNTAKAYESTANAAVFLGVAFALATYYSFRSGNESQGPMLLGANSVGLRIRF